MNKPWPTLLLWSTLWLAPVASHAVTCEELRAQVEDKIRRAGVAEFSVRVVDADEAAAANPPGKIVGHCAQGTKRIVYVRGAAADAHAAPAPASAAPRAPARTPRVAPPASAPVLTECKDGTVTLGDCRH